MAEREKKTLRAIQEKASRGEKLSMLALYDYPLALLAEESGVDLLLVGDSVAMNVYGGDDTLGADMEMLIRHTQAVRRGAPGTYLIGDMPYMSYQPSIETAIRNAGRFLAEGRADAIKIEGGRNVLDIIEALVKAGVPVMSHLGYLPQSTPKIGRGIVQGREAQTACELVEEAKQLERAGIAMLVLECVPPPVSEAIVARVGIPVIGIGSGPACHGQVLVVHDILGLYPRMTPKFVRKFADLKDPITRAIGDYVQAVGAGTYPAPEQCYGMKPGESEAFHRLLEERKI